MYKQIIPATDWLYVSHHKEMDSVSLFYIAAWALCEDDGAIIGLISLPGEVEDNRNKSPRLYAVPPSKTGFYKHINELNGLEKKALEKGGYLKHASEYKAQATV